MTTCVYVLLCVRVCVFVYLYEYTCVCARAFVRMCVCTCVCMCIHFAAAPLLRQCLIILGHAASNLLHSLLLGLARTIYIRCIYSILGREMTKYGHIRCIYTALANPLQ